MDTVKIYNARDNFEADRIIELLEDNDIECFAMESGSGGYLTIQQGFSVFGKDIYVNAKKKDKARAIVDEYVSSVSEEDTESIDGTEEGTESLEESEEDLEYKVPWFRNRVIVARIIIIVAILVGIITFIAR